MSSQKIYSPFFLKTLSSIFADIAQVFLATAVIPFFFNRDYQQVYIGIILTVASWALSLTIAINVKEAR